MTPEQPQRPAGMQAPGVAGAGNLLDPEVRAEIRERLHPAVHDAGQLARGQKPEEEESPSASEDSGEEAQAAQTPAEPASTASEPHRHRAGPYPHGDVDLRGFVANVPAEGTKIRRGRAGRRFYFLQQEPREGGEPPAG